MRHMLASRGRIAAEPVASGAAVAVFTGDWLSIGGGVGVYADTPNNAAYRPSTQFDWRLRFRIPEYPPKYLGEGTGVQQAFVGIWGGGDSGDERCVNVAINTSGNIILNMSTNGTNITGTLVAVPSSPIQANQWYDLRVIWTNAGLGPASVFLVPVASDTTAKTTAWGTAIGTGNIDGGTTLHTSTNALEFGATSNGTGTPFKGDIAWVDLRNVIDGALVLSADFRNATAGSETYNETVANRVITIHPNSGGGGGGGGGGGAVPVGMPLGTEAPNVGPTANVLGHVGIDWDDLSPMVDTLVITTAMANGFTETAMREDSNGDLRLFRVVRRLNVRVAILITSTTSVMIADSRYGMVICQGQNDYQHRSEWNVCTRSPCRSDDTAFTATQIWNGTGEEGLPTTACLNGATRWGTAPHLIVVASDGLFTDACYRVSGAGGFTAYRDNAMGNTDLAFVGDKAQLRVIDVWDHDHIWFKTDAARKNASPNQSHCDVVKINSSRGVWFEGGRTDKWLMLNTDYASCTRENHFRGPNWDVLQTDPGYKFFKQGQARIGTAYFISNQVGFEAGTLAAATTTTVTLDPTKRINLRNYYTRPLEITSGAMDGQSRTITSYNPVTGVATVSPAFASAPVGATYRIDLQAQNLHVKDWRFDGPTNAAFLLGGPVQKVFTASGCVFDTVSGAQEISADPGTATPSLADVWHWKSSGANANRDHLGNILAAPEPNMTDSDEFTPITWATT